MNHNNEVEGANKNSIELKISINMAKAKDNKPEEVVEHVEVELIGKSPMVDTILNEIKVEKKLASDEIKRLKASDVTRMSQDQYDRHARRIEDKQIAFDTLENLLVRLEELYGIS